MEAGLLIAEPSPLSHTSSIAPTPSSSTSSAVKRLTANGFYRPDGKKKAAIEDKSDAEDRVPLLANWTKYDIYKYFLGSESCSEYAVRLLNHKVDGASLLHLNREDFIEMDIKIGPRCKIIEKIKLLKNWTPPAQPNSKRNDHKP